MQQATSAGTQNRWFTYDNRGFLASEQHPEKGGTVSYSNYDARGHARNKTDGPNNLTFSFDRAERLTQVTGTGGQPLRTFTVSPGYTNGFLTSVPGWASSISYHPNGMLKQVSHVERHRGHAGHDPDMMRRRP